MKLYKNVQRAILPLESRFCSYKFSSVFLLRVILFLFLFDSLSVVANVLKPQTQLANNGYSVGYSRNCTTRLIIEQQQEYSKKYFHKKFYPKNELSRLSQKLSQPMLSFKIEKVLPHPSNISTQGMLIKDDFVYESSGSLGDSKIVKYSFGDLIGKSRIYGKSTVSLPSNIFAEGIAASKNLLYLVTLKKEKLLVIDLKSLDVINDIKVKNDAWGVVYLGNSLLISRGDSTIDSIELATGLVKNSSVITSQNVPLFGVNEMEVSGGFIYANVWPTDCIAVIEPDNYSVVAWIDIAQLYPSTKRQHWSHIANGIAFDSSSGRMLVTGKHWDKSFYLNVSEPLKLKSK